MAVREPGGCCVIVAFRSAKGLCSQINPFAERKATMGESASRVDVVSLSPFAPRKVCVLKFIPFADFGESTQDRGSVEPSERHFSRRSC